MNEHHIKFSVTDATMIFFTAFSTILFEVFLSRFFAVIMDYSYVFLVVSLATLGAGIGGYAAYRSPKLFYSQNTWVFTLFFFSLFLVIALMYVLPYTNLLIYLIMSMIPFIFSGFILTTILRQSGQRVPLLYAFDLIGAGLGAVSAIHLMNMLEPVRMISWVAFAGIAVSLFIGGQKKSRWNIAVYTIVLSIAGGNLLYPYSNLFPFQGYLTSPHNIFSKEDDVEMVYSTWDAFSRTDIYGSKEDELLYITIDGGAVSPVSRYTGDFQEVDYLRNTTSMISFQQVPKGKALIIGAGGGQEVLTARMAGFRYIEAVDINTGSFQAVQAVSDFAGEVYGLPGVHTIAADGRNYIRKTDNKYDVIYLSLVKKEADNGIGLAMSENYIYTKEAIGDYMDKLNNSGQLAFLLHNEKELAKIVHATMNYFRQQGISETKAAEHLSVVGTYQHLGHTVAGMGDTVITRPLILIRKEPYSKEESIAVLDQVKKINQIPIHIPHVQDQFSTLMTLFEGLDIDVTANTDDRPFFFNEKSKISLSIWISIAILCITAWYFSRRSKLSSGQLFYFSGTAIGFMMIEVTLIPILTLPLGHPTISFVVVLGILLVSGGIGSLFSPAWYKKQARRYIPLILIAILTVFSSFMIRMLGDDLPSEWPAAARVAIIGLMLFPLGFFMGMPLPYVMRRLRRDRIAAAWILNGIMGVIGSMLAVLLTPTFGLSTTLIMGGGIYSLLFFFQPQLRV